MLFSHCDSESAVTFSSNINQLYLQSKHKIGISVTILEVSLAVAFADSRGVLFISDYARITE
jgi:hypothetical protein